MMILLSLGGKNMLKNEILLDAEYADIIVALLNPPFNISSVTKLIFIAFCVKHEDRLHSYSNRTKDFVDLFFENISLKLSTHYSELNNILKVVDILIDTSKVIIDEDEIELRQDIDFDVENIFLKSCMKKVPNPIVEINKLDAKALIEEVVRYV